MYIYRVQYLCTICLYFPPMTEVVDSTLKRWQIEEDILLLARDFIRQAPNGGHVSVREISKYVVSVIFHIYDRTKYKKYLFPEMVEQIVSQKFRLLNDSFCFRLPQAQRQEEADRVQYLRTVPQETQRSPAWYAKRYNQIGASELSTVFNKNPFCSQKKYILKKTVPPVEPGATPAPGGFTGNKFTQHGVKFEDVAIQLYEARRGVQVYEFGSIDDAHIPFISASPDGITEDGVMLEIKCPYKREIIGLPPVYYWYQMQQQLHVCNLTRCDFLECKITEYSSWTEFLEDGDGNKSALGLEKGVILEYIKPNAETDRDLYGYLYPTSLNLTLDEIYTWDEQMKQQLEKNGHVYSKIIPWRLERYSCIPVYRHTTWWGENIDTIRAFWETILHMREDSRITPCQWADSQVKKRSSNKTSC